MRDWQARPLEEIYAVVFLDAVHFHVRSKGQIVKKAVYVAIGLRMDVTEQAQRQRLTDSFINAIYCTMIKPYAEVQGLDLVT